MTNTKNYTIEQMKEFTLKGIFIANGSFYKLVGIRKNGYHNRNGDNNCEIPTHTAEFQYCDENGETSSGMPLKFEIHTNYKMMFFRDFSEPLSILDMCDTDSYINGEDKNPDSFRIKASNANEPKYWFLEKIIEEFFTNNAKIQQNQTNIARGISLQYPVSFTQRKKSLCQPSAS